VAGFHLMQALEPFSKDDLARRRRRSIAMATVLVLMVLLFFVTTLVRLGGSIAERSM
jgi:hypothetical protein